MTRLLAGVAGWPVEQSKSPRLHGFWLRQYGIDGDYVKLAVAPQDLARRLKELPGEGFKGLNLTIPHKEAALPLLDEVDAKARRIGAVNTIVFDAAGKSFGSSTDGYGFIENLKQNHPGFDARRGPAVLLGAGGAGASIAFALLDAGCPEIRVVNRSQDKAQALADRLEGRGRVQGWDKRAASLAEAALLVNATSLGMTGQPALDLDLRALPETALVTDIVYAPLETDLLRAARQRGNLAVDGLGMLLHQAVPGFEAWFGRRPEVTAQLRAHVLGAD